MIKTKGLLSIILIILCTASCRNQSIIINIDIPDQISKLFEKKIFLKITTEFENFIYRHPNQQSLSIDIGTPQSILFKKTTKRIFSHVETGKLSKKNTPSITIVPKLTNIEISKPEESGLSTYECRLEYSILVKTREYAINHKILAYSRAPKSNKNENQIISELISQCMRSIASKLEIKLLELTNEI